LTGHNKTDSVNRALLVYAFLERNRHEGGEFGVVGKDGVLVKVQLL
jgi:hypothetical protein